MSRQCLFYRRHLSAYIDGEISGPLKTEIKGHLAECSSCRQEAESLVAMMKEVENFCIPVPDTTLDRTVMFRISESKRGTGRYRLIAASVYSAALGLIIGVYLANGILDQTINKFSMQDNTVIQSMDVFSPYPSGSFAEVYFSMINEFGLHR